MDNMQQNPHYGGVPILLLGMYYILQTSMPLLHQCSLSLIYFVFVGPSSPTLAVAASGFEDPRHPRLPRRILGYLPISRQSPRCLFCNVVFGAGAWRHGRIGTGVIGRLSPAATTLYETGRMGERWRHCLDPRSTSGAMRDSGTLRDGVPAIRYKRYYTLLCPWPPPSIVEDPTRSCCRESHFPFNPR